MSLTKSILGKSILVSTLLACGVATIAAAQSNPATNPVANPAKHSHVRAVGAMPDSPFFHAVHQLNLSAEQQTTIHGYLEAAKQKQRSNVTPRPNADALANPGDPYYPAAVADAKTLAANRIQQNSDLEVQIYGALTHEQQAKLPQVLADMKAQHMQHHAEHHQKHDQKVSSNTTSPVTH